MLRTFFHKYFCTLGEIVSSQHIKMSFDQESYQKVEMKYTEGRLSGCAASVNCIHVLWDRCPAGLRNICKNGKNSFSALVFKVAMPHSKRIMHVSQYFWATVNCKSILHLDRLFSMFNDTDAFLRKRVAGRGSPTGGRWCRKRIHT